MDRFDINMRSCSRLSMRPQLLLLSPCLTKGPPNPTRLTPYKSTNSPIKPRQDSCLTKSLTDSSINRERFHYNCVAVLVQSVIALFSSNATASRARDLCIRSECWLQECCIYSGRIINDIHAFNIMERGEAMLGTDDALRLPLCGYLVPRSPLELAGDQPRV